MGGFSEVCGSACYSRITNAGWPGYPDHLKKEEILVGPPAGGGVARSYQLNPKHLFE
jgi:hypothetical protein